MSSISVFYDRQYLGYGVKYPIALDLKATPMVLIAGQTGSGKTYATRYLLAKIIKSAPDTIISIIDFKQFDFSNFADTPRYFGYETAFDGLQQFNNEFNKRLNGTDTSRNRKILLFDEWSAFLASCDKKKAEEAKAVMQKILSLGRAYNISCIVGCQKAMSDLFSGGSRDNFGITILLGNASKEQRQMLLSDYIDELSPNCRRGEGHMAVSGTGLKHIVVPKYDQQKADLYICKALRGE